MFYPLFLLFSFVSRSKRPIERPPERYIRTKRARALWSPPLLLLQEGEKMEVQVEQGERIMPRLLQTHRS
jgi:hypothetical protein